MPTSINFSNLMRHLFSDSQIYFALKVLLAVLGLIGFALFSGNLQLTLQLTLGVVSGAIAETDDCLSGRFKNLVATLICFFIASLSVQYLYPIPWLFTIGLIGSTFLFVMVGALGPRYGSISFGSLLIAIYTMLGASSSPSLLYLPLTLCAGALWYGIVSLIWLWFLPYKTLHEQLAQSFFALSRYIFEKSNFFPVDDHGCQQVRHNLAQLNINVVNGLNLTKTALNNRISLKTEQTSAELANLLQLYLLALDIHERAISSHYPYGKLESELQQGRILTGFQEAFLLLSEACQQLGYVILTHKPYRHSRRIEWALDALSDQLEFTHLKKHYPKSLLTPMKFLRRNLANINQLLKSAETIQHSAILASQLPTLARPERLPRLTQLKRHLTLDSMFFRHAVRLSLGMGIGYGMIQAFSLEKGFWILLTTLFVCQPSYIATRRRLVQRVIGTFSGILVGIPLLLFFSSFHGLLIIMVTSIFLFFTQVRTNYSIAVCFITIYVLATFHVIDGAAFTILGPRLLETLIGSLLSYLLVARLWPDWQYRRLPALIASALSSNARYLTAVVTTIQQQHVVAIDYRIARKNAQLADKDLAMAWQTMLIEPKKRRRFLDLCFSLTWRNHALLSYIAALGAHRDNLEAIDGLEQLSHHITQTLEQAAGHLSGCATTPLITITPVLAQESSEEQLMLTQQLTLISELAEQLLHLANESRILLANKGATST